MPKFTQYTSVQTGAPVQAGASVLLVKTESWNFFCSCFCRSSCRIIVQKLRQNHAPTDLWWLVNHSLSPRPSSGGSVLAWTRHHSLIPTLNSEREIEWQEMRTKLLKHRMAHQKTRLGRTFYIEACNWILTYELSLLEGLAFLLAVSNNFCPRTSLSSTVFCRPDIHIPLAVERSDSST